METDSYHNISVDDFAALLQIPLSELPLDCRKLIETSDLRHKIITGKEKETIILDILKKIESPDLTIAGNESKARWQEEWDERLKAFINSGYNIAALTPRFLRPDRPLRFAGKYIKPVDPHFELAIYTIVRRYLFRENFADPAITTIYEFGCGTGYNLVEIASLYPGKELHGLDWVSGPKEIVERMREHYGYKMTGHIFNMLEPDTSFRIKPGSAILAMGALEQIGVQFEAFLQFILAQKPSIFVHVDSILEWYDENSLMDHLAIAFCKKRKYLQDYWSRLEQLEKEGKIEILKKWRSPFGSFFLDSSSVIVWRPTEKP